jgi:hypothetical protein
MTDNRQRAAEVVDHYWHIAEFRSELKDDVAAALDEAEARGRAEVATKVEAVANECHTEGRRRIGQAQYVAEWLRDHEQQADR